MKRDKELLCLGRKIAKLRREKGYTQKVLAKKADISCSYLSKLECGKNIPGVSLEILLSISACLDIEKDQLLRVTSADIKELEFYNMQCAIRERQRAYTLALKEEDEEHATNLKIKSN